MHRAHACDDPAGGNVFVFVELVAGQRREFEEGAAGVDERGDSTVVLSQSIEKLGVNAWLRTREGASFLERDVCLGLFAVLLFQSVRAALSSVP